MMKDVFILLFTEGLIQAYLQKRSFPYSYFWYPFRKISLDSESAPPPPVWRSDQDVGTALRTSDTK